MVDLRTAVTLAALVLGAFALRLTGLDAQGTWYDEAMSLRYATAPWMAIPGLAAADVHPPLHFLVLKAWVDATGLGDWTVRIPGVLLGTLAVPLVAQLGRQLTARLGGASPQFSATVGLVAAGLLAISPLAVWYSQEARMYQQSLVLGLLAALGLVRALVAARDGGRAWPWWAVFAFAGIAGLFTHYAGALLLLGLGAGGLAWCLGLLLRARTKGLRALGGLALATVAVVVAYLPWVPIAFDRFGNDVSYFETPPAPLAIIGGTLVAFSGGWPADALGVEPAWLLAGALVLVAVGIGGGLTLVQGGRSAWPAALLAAWLLVPLLAWLVITLDRPKVAERYLLVLLPSWLLLLGLGLATLLTVAATGRTALARLSGYLAGAAAVLLLGLQAASGLEVIRDGDAVRRPDIRGIAATIRAEAQPGDVVVAVGGHGQVALQRYLWQNVGGDGRLAVTGIPDITVFDLRAQVTGPEALARLRELDAEHGRLWLVLWQRELGDPAGSVLRLLEEQRPRLDVGGRYVGADVLLFQLGGETPLQPETAGARPVGAQLALAGGGTVTLEAWRPAPETWQAGQTAGVSLFWRPGTTPDTNLTGFVQLLTDDDRIVAQADQPAGGDVYQSRRWQPGSLVTDRYRLAIPADTPPGSYRVIAGLYRPDGVRLAVRGGPAGSGSDFVLLDRVEVRR